MRDPARPRRDHFWCEASLGEPEGAEVDPPEAENERTF